MRADRLVATLLFLQSKGRATAAEVAAELEVSERTARRDLEALSMAGIPVFSVAGKGGGWSLIGGARTDLTGLSATEARALMLMTGSAPAASPELKAAVRKLVQALPESFRADAEAATEAVVVDPSRWGQHRRPSEAPPFLGALQEAVVKGKRVQLGYETPGKGRSVRVVHPLGLLVKATVWYLLAGTDSGDRVFRVSRVTSVELTDEPAFRPDHFDLEEMWQRLNERFAALGGVSAVAALARPEIVPTLLRVLGGKVVVGDEQQDGRVMVTVSGPSDFRVAVDLAAFGGAVEVIEAPGVSRQLARIGRELVATYG